MLLEGTKINLKMKHRPVKNMLNNPDSIDATHIADYAIFNTSDNDSVKSINIVNLIIAYTKSISKISTK